MGSLKIDMLGTSFSVQAKEDDEYLNAIFNYYKQEVHRIEKQGIVKDGIKIAILAGISMCDETFKAKQAKQKTQLAYENDVTNSESAQIVDDLLEKLNSVL